jgi:hypothetical protein
MIGIDVKLLLKTSEQYRQPRLDVRGARKPLYVAETTRPHGMGRAPRR